MKTVRRTGAACTQELDDRIPRAVRTMQKMEGLAAELKADKDAIKSLLGEAELQRYAVRGFEALLVDEERLSWNAEKLAVLFGKDEEKLDQFVPRKPETAKLKAELEAHAGTDAGKELRACAKASHTTRLELAAPAEEPKG